MIIAIPIIGIILSSPESENINTADINRPQEDLAIGIEVSLDDVETIANLFLDQESKDSDIQYDLVLGDQAQLLGQTSYLGIPFDFSANMTPETLDNGNVMLHINELALSGYELPQNLILNIIARQVDLPDFIVFNPDDSYIGINLDEYELDNGGQITVDQLDLDQDTVQVTIHLPHDVFQ